MSLYYLILWNQVDILQKHFKKDHVHMRLWTRFYGMTSHLDECTMVGMRVKNLGKLHKTQTIMYNTSYYTCM